MPFITFTKEGSPLYINIDHVAGMKLTVENEKNTAVKIIASRPELDTTVFFDTEADAQAFIDDLVAYSLKASQPAFEATVTTTTTVPKRATVRRLSRPAAPTVIR
ncbi:hypothetical protein JAO73_13410 [Hymenobacter sp. BT523]|uniref:hypothetical protein n=1 Tax=Hymenobacter sp. BT523 TaxID=2795725 RepID=UPI0018EC7B15|nr:hypothetical protein [Hymenobacter sp. BT523]MBJ6110014.1 hypothetical protein [Hymenobacter sp. BT523]